MFDETFDAMRTLLSTSVQWHLFELAEMLGLLLRSFKLESDRDMQRYDNALPRRKVVSRMLTKMAHKPNFFAKLRRPPTTSSNTHPRSS